MTNSRLLYFARQRFAAAEGTTCTSAGGVFLIRQFLGLYPVRITDYSVWGGVFLFTFSLGVNAGKYKRFGQNHSIPHAFPFVTHSHLIVEPNTLCQMQFSQNKNTNTGMLFWAVEHLRWDYLLIQQKQNTTNYGRSW
jgi:hypothetical protein